MRHLRRVLALTLLAGCTKLHDLPGVRGDAATAPDIATADSGADASGDGSAPDVTTADGGVDASALDVTMRVVGFGAMVPVEADGGLRLRAVGFGGFQRVCVDGGLCLRGGMFR